MRKIELEEKIKFNLKEIDIMNDLLEMSKYKEDKALISRYKVFEDETYSLLNELEKINNYSMLF